MLSPSRMTRCPVCDGSGKTGTNILGFGGTSCALCHGKEFLLTEPHPCPCCNANGGFPSLFGLRWDTCRLCHGVKFLLEKPHPCPKCSATGRIKGFGGVFSSPCDLCDKACYIRRPHGTCIKCNTSSLLSRYFVKCINCKGIRYSPNPQYLCPRCNSTGRVVGNNCMLCSGNGVIHHAVASCANCNGAGDVKRLFSLVRGRQSCPTCQGQGYFAISGASMPPPKPKKKGKRGHESMEGEGDDSEEQDQDGRDEEVVGGSEPRRVKHRPTPAGKNRRKTISAGDIPGPQQQPPPPPRLEPMRQPLLGDDEGPGDGGGSAGEAGGFNVGVAGPASARNGKRPRRSGV